MESKNSREEMIRSKILEDEQKELVQLSGIRFRIMDYLLKDRGFAKEHILIDPEFEISLSDCKIKVSIDFLVRLDDTDYAGGGSRGNSIEFPRAVDTMIIRCAPTSIESWERYILAFARVVSDYQIPYAVVTDSERARVLDVLGNRLIGERIEDIPSKDDLLRFLRSFRKIPFSPEKLEREKRIVYAFEGVKCSVINSAKG